MTQNFYVPHKVMVIMAHPDDIEFSCSGTIAKWVKAGAEAAYVLCTSGDVGIAKPGMTKIKAAEIREAEQQAAAEVVGVNNVTFLRYPDGMLENTMELRKKLVREIRRFKPEVLITGDPTKVFTERGGINHPDHRAAAGAAVDAVFPAVSQPNLFEDLAAEGISPHRVRKVYITFRGEGDTFVNISDTIDLKIKALQAHVSQLGEWDLEEPIKARAAEAAKGKEMAYAEVFKVINMMTDEAFEKMMETGEVN